jgi:iron complex outermembrane receptor protein
LTAALGAVALALAAASVRAADRKVSSQELSQRGFFTDFDEIDLGALLEGKGTQISVAARRDEPLTEASGTVTLITADEIRALGVRTLDEVLRLVPGFDVVADNLGRPHIVSRGIPGGRTGASSDSVLILLDGHRLNEDLHGGATVLNLAIPITGLARIEILRGPASALYGEAAGAIIHLISENPAAAKPDDPPTRLTVAAGDGSFSQQQVGMNIGGRVGDLKFVGFLQFADTAGAQLTIPADAQTVRDLESGDTAVSIAPGRTTDRIRGLESVYRINYHEFDLLWRMKQERSGGFIGPTDSLGTQNNIDNRQLLLDVTWRRRVRTGTLTTVASFTRNRLNELLEVIPPGFQRVVEGRQLRVPSAVFLQTALGTVRTSAEARYDYTVERHELLAGVTLERESTFGLQATGNLDFQTFVPRESLEPLPGTVADVTRNIAGLWLTDVWRARPKTTITGAVRLESVSAIGAQLSPRLVVTQQLPHELTARLSYARSYRAPSFRELAFDLPTLSANPDLGAASLNMVEASLMRHRDNFDVSGSLYVGWLRNTIEPLGTPSLEAPAPLVNAEGANLRGLELQTKRYFKRHTAFISYSFQSPHDIATDRRAPGIPLHMAALGGTFAVDERLSVVPTWILRTSRARDLDDVRPALAGYGLVNLTVRRLFLPSKSLEVRAILNNALDQSYRDPSPSWGVPGDYPRPGRSLFVDAKYRF